MSENARRCTGAAVGACVGVMAYYLMLVSKGIYIPAAIGAGPALGVSWAARTKSLAWGVATMVLAVVLTLLVKFVVGLLRDERSSRDFLTFLGNLSSWSLITLLVVAVLGFWFGRGREPKRSDAA